MFELSRNVHELESLRLHKDLRVNCEGSGWPPFQCKCCSITYVIKDILIGEDVQFDHDINNNEDVNSSQKDLEQRCCEPSLVMCSGISDRHPNFL